MLFGKTKAADINILYEEYKSLNSALLIDVRSKEEYQEGHIPGNINIPLNSMEDINRVAPSYEQKIYLYCYSGFRSGKALNFLKSMGYENLVNMGGFSQYSGEIEY